MPRDAGGIGRTGKKHKRKKQLAETSSTVETGASTRAGESGPTPSTPSSHETVTKRRRVGRVGVCLLDRLHNATVRATDACSDAARAATVASNAFALRNEWSSVNAQFWKKAERRLRRAGAVMTEDQELQREKVILEGHRRGEAEKAACAAAAEKALAFARARAVVAEAECEVLRVKLALLAHKPKARVGGVVHACIVKLEREARLI